jgi:hypothetical protein
MTSKTKELYKLKLPPGSLTRGPTISLPPDQLCVFDYMPKILVMQFATQGPLRKNRHRGGIVPLFYNDMYREFAEEQLKKGKTIEALEAYKRGLGLSIGFSEVMGKVGKAFGHVVVSEKELDALFSDKEYASLEKKLVINSSSEFDLAVCNEFTKLVRTEVARAERLFSKIEDKLGDDGKPIMREYPNYQVNSERYPCSNSAYCRLLHEQNWNVLKNKKLGRELAQLLEETGAYIGAGRVYGDLGDWTKLEEMAELAEQARKNMEPPKLMKRFEELRKRRMEEDRKDIPLDVYSCLERLWL